MRTDNPWPPLCRTLYFIFLKATPNQVGQPNRTSLSLASGVRTSPRLRQSESPNPLTTAIGRDVGAWLKPEPSQLFPRMELDTGRKTLSLSSRVAKMGRYSVTTSAAISSLSHLRFGHSHLLCIETLCANWKEWGKHPEQSWRIKRERRIQSWRLTALSDSQGSLRPTPSCTSWSECLVKHRLLFAQEGVSLVSVTRNLKSKEAWLLQHVEEREEKSVRVDTPDLHPELSFISRSRGMWMDGMCVAETSDLLPSPPQRNVSCVN